HATVPTGFLLFFEMPFEGKQAMFETRSGRLVASRRDDKLELDFPSRRAVACDTPDALVRALGRKPREVLRSRDYLAVFGTEAEVAALAPDMTSLATLDCHGVIVTAPRHDADFVCRFFPP